MRCRRDHFADIFRSKSATSAEEVSPSSRIMQGEVFPLIETDIYLSKVRCRRGNALRTDWA